MIGKIKGKYRIILIIVFILILLVVYFRPRTLWSTLGLEDVGSNSIIYYTISDIIKKNNQSWSGPLSELLGQHNELFGALFHEVSIAGPVLYKNSVINPEQVNLYLTLTKEDETYQSKNLELILSYGETPDTYFAFINIDNRGYFVTSGKSVIASFIQEVTNTMTYSSYLP